MDHDGSNERKIRAAKNQALFRVINERLESIAQTFQFVAEHTTFTCECADVTCIEPMRMTLEEYEALRSHPNRFAVLPGHVDHHVEDVVAENEWFVVVAKAGKGAKVAKTSYPRLESRSNARRD